MEYAVVFVILLVAAWTVARALVRTARGGACGGCGRRHGCGADQAGASGGVADERGPVR